jgi:hypothetical protein
LEKSKVIEKLFEHIVVYSYLILPVLYLITRTKTRDGKIFAIYGVVFWSLLFFYKEIPKDFRTVAYQPVFTLLEYLFFSTFFYFNIQNTRYRKIIIGLSIFFILFQLVYVLVFEKSRVDSIPIGVESILIFIYISLFFLENLKNPANDYIYNNHCFWISAGLLIYLGGSFFINILANSFSDEEFSKYWYLNYIADTIKTLLFAVAFLVLVANNKKRTQKAASMPYLDMI